jgi:hypothetical protein
MESNKESINKRKASDDEEKATTSKSADSNKRSSITDLRTSKESTKQSLNKPKEESEFPEFDYYFDKFLLKKLPQNVREKEKLAALNHLKKISNEYHAKKSEREDFSYEQLIEQAIKDIKSRITAKYDVLPMSNLRPQTTVIESTLSTTKNSPSSKKSIETTSSINNRPWGEIEFYECKRLVLSKELCDSECEISNKTITQLEAGMPENKIHQSKQFNDWHILIGMELKN